RAGDVRSRTRRSFPRTLAVVAASAGRDFGVSLGFDQVRWASDTRTDTGPPGYHARGPPNGGSAAFLRRVGEWGRHLHVNGAVGVGPHATRVRELAEPRAVRPHREDLLPERIRADRIAARREQHRPADLIGRRAERPDSAARGAEYAPDPVR